MRMTQSMLSRSNMSYISNNYKQYSNILDQINSGKKITLPSQDPVIAIKGMAYRSQVAETEQFERNLIEATSWLDNADASLDETTKVLQRVRELTVQASNDTYNPTERKAIAAEIKELQGHLENISNTQVNHKYIFNGTNVNSKPVDGTNIEKSISDFVNGNGPEFDLLYKNQKYTFDHESQDSFVFKSGNAELMIHKKDNSVIYSIQDIKNPDVKEKVQLKDMVISDKHMSDLTMSNGSDFAIYHQEKLYTSAFQFIEDDGSTSFVFRRGDEQLTINPETSSITLDQDIFDGENEIEQLTESDMMIIPSLYLWDLTQGKGSEFVVHYQDKPYVFEHETDGVFVFKNGDAELTIDKNTPVPSITWDENINDDENEPVNVKQDEMVLSNIGLTDIVSSNGSEFVIHFENQQYTFNKWEADGGSGVYVFKSGEQELKVEIDPNTLSPSITLNQDYNDVDNKSETLESSDLIISNKDAISSNDQDFEMEILKGINVPVNIRPQNVYSADLFKDLSDLVKVLEDPSATGNDITTFLSKIDNHIDRVLNERAELGARHNRIELMADRLSRQNMVAKQALSKNEDIDLEKAITDLKTQEMIHQAALAVGARIIQPTLMDFLR